LSRHEKEMSLIGKNALEFHYAILRKMENQNYSYRSISGILSLRKTFDDNTIEQACKRALWYDSVTYGTVKRICENGLASLPTGETIEVETPDESNQGVLELSAYVQLSMMGVIKHE